MFSVIIVNHVLMSGIFYMGEFGSIVFDTKKLEFRPQLSLDL